jgi:hypothetical protein
MCGGAAAVGARLFGAALADLAAVIDGDLPGLGRDGGGVVIEVEELDSSSVAFL